jgi:tetratricopeptide (TPR) repeat protein
MNSFGSLLPQGAWALGDPDQIRRGRRLRSVGVTGALGSIAVFVAGKLIAQFGGTFSVVLLTLLGASLALIAWTRLWIKESKEPFQYTYSVGEFEETEREEDPGSRGPIGRLPRDLKEKLSERVGRLSLLEEDAVAPEQPGDEPASHVHISGWHCVREDDDGWELEVVPEVRLGGANAPARLARSVRLRLDPSTSERAPLDKRPRLTPGGYEMLFERVYWSVASEIYAQIQIGVKRKVRLLPRGTLRAGAFVHEAEDYATSNTLDAYSAAQRMYRQALEIYDVRYRERAATWWRRRASRALTWVADRRRAFRSWAAEVWRGAGRREVMTARAELGLARMLAAEWHLGRLCGIARKDIYEATGFVDHALERIKDLPEDVPERREVLFRAYVTQATINVLLDDYPGSRKALKSASKLIPTKAREDADYLFAAGMTEPDQLLSLRLFAQAVALDPAMERALFHKAEKYDKIWRRRDSLESEVALTVDAAYRDVIALNPGNLQAWGRRGYLGWMLAEGDTKADSARWREHATSMLRTGRQYKEVRREASVAELDWNLARLAAEQGEFVPAYGHYIEAVSARLADPRIDFERDFYLNPTEAFVERFKRYEARVLAECGKAEEDGEVPERMIHSVQAFVLNDCGLAYLAHHDRSGSHRSLAEAQRAFETARAASKAFVLPTHNLAHLYRQRSEMPGTPEEQDESLRRAAVLLSEVLTNEPDWAPAQLLMVEVQTALSARLEVALKNPKERGEAGERSAAVTQIDGEQVDPVAVLEAERTICLASAEHCLRALLPHRQLLDREGSHRVDAFGSQVPSLVADEEIRWTEDFDAFHVSALGRWALLLATTAPTAADSLCQMLRAKYCAGNIHFLIAHLNAAKALVDVDPEDKDAARTHAECVDLVREVIRLALLEDPVHWTPLQATELLPPDQRLDSYKTALERGASATVLIWIGDALRSMGELGLALHSYRAAGEGEDGSMAPLAALKIGLLFEDEGTREADAIEAYSRATETPDALLATEAAIRVAHLLEKQGDRAGAQAVILRVGARPEVAWHLGARLEGEGKRSEAMQIYRAASASDDDPLRAAELRLRLALLLFEDDEKGSEMRDLLRRLLGEDVESVRWKAKVLLARSLADDTPDESRRLFREVLDENEPTAVALAAWELARLMKAAGEGEAAETLLREQAEAGPAVASQLAELGWEGSPEPEKEPAAAEPVPT